MVAASQPFQIALVPEHVLEVAEFFVCAQRPRLAFEIGYVDKAKLMLRGAHNIAQVERPKKYTLFMQFGNKAPQVGPQRICVFRMDEQLAQRQACERAVVNRVTLDAGDSIDVDDVRARNTALFQ